VSASKSFHIFAVAKLCHCTVAPSYHFYLQSLSLASGPAGGNYNANCRY